MERLEQLEEDRVKKSGVQRPLTPPLPPSSLKEWQRLRPGEQSSKYFNLIRSSPYAPAPCIVCNQGNTATHPSQPRKFSIEELCIICGFPPDFILTGTYAQQWERLGRAVPPPMMRAVAATLRDGLFTRLGRTRPGFIDAFTRKKVESGLAKPSFHLPTMADVAAARGTTGLTAVSTFAGCGGSCLGFEMAGFEMLWASEFVPAAQDTYRANHPHTQLDGRDIRQVKPEEILAAIGMQPGELDVLNGSPPCASFSSAGKRDAGWGQVKAYSDTKQRTDDLFFEFVRILHGLQPRAFVAENVAGLTRGVAIGYFKEIMRALDGAGYHVKCKILDSQWLGVPQARQRAIFVGVRKDLGEQPEHPRPQPFNYTLREVLPGLARVYQAPSGAFRTEPIEHIDRPASTIIADHRGRDDWKVIDKVVHDTGGLYGAGDVTDRPCPTITVGNSGGGGGAPNSQHFRVHERKPGQLGEKATAQWRSRKMGETRGSGDPQKIIRESPDKPAHTVTAVMGSAHPYEPRRFTMDELRIVCGFPPDFILKGTYAQQWERLGRAVPPPLMRAVAATLRDGLFTRLGRTRPGFFEAR